MIQALLFDIGNVIVRFDFRKTIAAIRGDMETESADALAAVADLTDQLELGQIAVDSFLEQVVERVKYRGGTNRLRSAFENIFELNVPMVEFIEARAAEDVQMFLLSNTNEIHVPFLFREYPVFSTFSGAIYSHEVGCMKPDPEIYRIAIRELGLRPDTTLYIDDMPANCEMGRAAGFPTIQYEVEKHGEFLREYGNLGGL